MANRTPLNYGEEIIGSVELVDEHTVISPEDQILLVRVEKRKGLVLELMKEELVFFDIQNIPAVRA